MYGNLADGTLPDALRQLAASGATGAVSLTAPGGSALIELRDGQIAHATSPAPSARIGTRLVAAGLLHQDDLEAALRSQGGSTDRRLGLVLVQRGLALEEAVSLVLREQTLDAVFEILRMRRGSFDWTPSTRMRNEVPCEMKLEEVLLDVARRQTEWAQLSRSVPDLDMVPSLVVGARATAGLVPEEIAMLARVDGRHTIRELADMVGHGHFDAARVIYGLMLLGVVSVPEHHGSHAPSALLSAPEQADRPAPLLSGWEPPSTPTGPIRREPSPVLGGASWSAGDRSVEPEVFVLRAEDLNEPEPPSAVDELRARFADPTPAGSSMASAPLLREREAAAATPPPQVCEELRRREERPDLGDTAEIMQEFKALNSDD